MKKKIMLSVLFTFLLPSLVFALGLDQAKAKGLVGEKPDGYLASVQASASAEVQNLVKDINSKRKKKYQSIARENGTSLQAVEVLAGKKAIQKTPAGQFIMSPNGSWKRK